MQELTDVKNRIDELIKTKPARAVLLYEIFIAGCYEKIEEIEEKELKKLEYLAEIVEKYREEVLKKSPSRLLYEFIWETGLIKMLTKTTSQIAAACLTKDK